MPSKKKKYNARFPAGRIKKIMQTDEEVGKVAQAVPVIIYLTVLVHSAAFVVMLLVVIGSDSKLVKTLELFVESLLTKSMQITLHRNAKTLTPSHMKQCILSESRFDFLKDLVKNIPDASVQEDNENNALEVTDYSAPKEEREIKEEKPNFYTEQSTSSARTPVIQFSPKVKIEDQIKIEVPEVQNVSEVAPVPNIHIDLSAMSGSFTQRAVPVEIAATAAGPSAPPVMVSSYGQNTSDNLYIDEDYDN